MTTPPRKDPPFPPQATGPSSDRKGRKRKAEAGDGKAGTPQARDGLSPSLLPAAPLSAPTPPLTQAEAAVVAFTATVTTVLAAQALVAAASAAPGAATLSEEERQHMHALSYLHEFPDRAGPPIPVQPTRFARRPGADHPELWRDGDDVVMATDLRDTLVHLEYAELGQDSAFRWTDSFHDECTAALSDLRVRASHPPPLHRVLLQEAFDDWIERLETRWEEGAKAAEE